MRFALDRYFTHCLVAFLLLFLLSPVLLVHADTPVLWESDTQSIGRQISMYAARWFAQTFDVESANHSVTMVKLYLGSVGSPLANMTLGIRAVSATGEPTGTDLTSGTLNTSTLSTTMAWYDIAVTEYNLTAYTSYAIVCRYITGNSTSYVQWGENGVFLNREYTSYDSGTTWFLGTLFVLMYQIWGNVLNGQYPHGYTLYGGYNETSLALNQNMSITSYPPNANPTSFTLNNSYVLNVTTASSPYTILSIDVGNNYTRHYTVKDATENIYVFQPDSPYATYYLSIIPLLSISNGYVESYLTMNGTIRTVERQQFSTNLIPFILTFGKAYGFRLYCDQGWYDFGSVVAGDPSVSIVFTVSSMNFPSSSVTYQNLTLSASRVNSTHIQVLYSDALNNSGTVTVSIYALSSNGTVLVTSDSQTVTGSYSLNWYDATPSAEYRVDVQSDTEYYGDHTWQFLLSPVAVDFSGFDLSFMGAWGFDSRQAIGFCLALFVFGSFGHKDRLLGLFATILLVGFLTWIGWLNVPALLLTAVGCLAVFWVLSQRRPS